MLARGDTAQILDARQLSLGRDVAVKVALEGLDADQAVLVEARFLAQLSHPNIVPLYALDVDESGRPRVQLKRLVGEPWSRLLRSHGDDVPDDPEERLAFHLRILLAVCDAVAHAHRRGILHLDINPANVMLGAFGEVYLVDFGAAATTDESLRGWVPMADQLVRPVGTPAYMSPEQAHGSHPAPTERTDIYLLGGLLHHILMGRPPHSGEGPKSSVVVAREGLPLDLEGSPGALASCCRRAMSQRPEDRFPVVASFRAEISGYLESRHARALMADAAARLEELEAQVSRGAGSGESQSKHTRELHRLFGASRFGFRAATETFGGRDARAGQARVERVMATHLLSTGAARHARQVIDRMEPAPEELRVALEDLEARLADEAARTEVLLHRVAERDPGRSARARARLLALVFIAGAVPMSAAGLAHALGLWTVTAAGLVAFQVVGVLAVAAGGLAQREAIAGNEISRQLILSNGLLASASLVASLTLLATGASMGLAAATGSLAYGTGAGFLALFFDRKLYPAGFALCCAAMLGAAFPSWSVLLVGAALGVILIGLVIIRSREAAALERS